MLLISRSMDFDFFLMFELQTVISTFFDLQLLPLAPSIFCCSNLARGKYFAVFAYAHYVVSSQYQNISHQLVS